MDAAEIAAAVAVTILVAAFLTQIDGVPVVVSVSIVSEVSDAADAIAAGVMEY